MSRSLHPAATVSRVVRRIGHALAEDSRRHPSTPMAESLALGLGLEPVRRIYERERAA